jgi:CRISPR-associated protein Csa3
MVRALFITLGFEEKFAVRALTRHGLDRGDRIILVTGPRIDKVDKAISFISDFISKYYGGEVDLHVEEVSVHDIYAAISSLRRILTHRSRDADRVIVNLSGGMRILIAAFIIALGLINIPNLTVEIETEDSSALIQIPTQIIKAWRHQVGAEKAEILKILVSRGDYMSSSEIARLTGKDESTIRRHLSKLREIGLVEVKRLKPLLVKASPTATIFV